MKKNITHLLFLAVFVLLALAPLAVMLIVGPAEPAANEILADPPVLQQEDGAWNLDYLTDCSDYLSDHFGLRQEMVTANAAIEAAVFQESAAEKVVLGKDGWLFYSTTLDDYQGSALLTDRQIWAAAHTLSMVEEAARERGMDFLFTIVPNKNTLYPQYMPSRYPAAEGAGNLEHLEAAMAAQQVSYLDLRSVLAAEDRILYQRLDSHWTNLGAALAHDAILDELGKAHEVLYQPDSFTTAQDHPADLYAMLYPTGTELDEQCYLNRPWQFTYARPIRSPEDQMIQTVCECQSGSLFMFRDSFGNTLHTFMAESFGKAAFSRAMPYNLSLLNTAPDADTLVIEIVQRNIPWLAERAPIMAAPRREIALPAAESPLSVTAECSEDGGMVCITGCIAEPLDTDSPVYLLADGVVYEASPVGEEGISYTAYLTERPERVNIMIVRDGVLLLSERVI